MEIDLKLCNFAAEKASLLGACPQQGVGMKVKNKPWHSLNYTPHLNDKVLDKEKALSAIKTSYLNSYKVIVAGARDFADYAYIKKKT